MTMAKACASTDAGMVQGLIGSVDCRVHDLAQTGYAALAGPGSPVGLLLTGLLTLYVVFIGYRLLLGRGGLRVGDATLQVIKVGLILALATNWNLFQTLVYDTLTRGPTEVGSLLLSGLQGQPSNPFALLQDAFDGLQQSATLMASRAGAGAAAIACTELIKAMGVRGDNVLMCDRTGVIWRVGDSAAPQAYATYRWASSPSDLVRQRLLLQRDADAQITAARAAAVLP